MASAEIPRMYHWNLIANGTEFILNGTVFGHSHIADGRKITTSPLATGELVEEHILFSTRNSQYLCPLEEVDPSCQLTKKYLLEQLPQEKERWDRYLNGDPTRPNCPLFDIKNLPIPDGAYLLALDAQRPYLFYGMFQKAEGRLLWDLRHPMVHLGMFTDSVLSMKTEGEKLVYDIRYFPKESATFRFYQLVLNPSITPFYVINVGEEEIQCSESLDLPQIQQLILQPWEYCQIPPILEHKKKNKVQEEIVEETVQKRESDQEEELIKGQETADEEEPTRAQETVLEEEPIENDEMTEEEDEIATTTETITVNLGEPSLFEEVSHETENNSEEENFNSSEEPSIPALQFEEISQHSHPEVEELKLDLAPTVEAKEIEEDES